MHPSPNGRARLPSSRQLLPLPHLPPNYIFPHSLSISLYFSLQKLSDPSLLKTLPTLPLTLSPLGQGGTPRRSAPAGYRPQPDPLSRLPPLAAAPFEPSRHEPIAGQVLFPTTTNIVIKMTRVFFLFFCLFC